MNGIPLDSVTTVMTEESPSFNLLTKKQLRQKMDNLLVNLWSEIFKIQEDDWCHKPHHIHKLEVLSLIEDIRKTIDE